MIQAQFVIVWITSAYYTGKNAKMTHNAYIYLYDAFWRSIMTQIWDSHILGAHTNSVKANWFELGQI